MILLAGLRHSRSAAMAVGVLSAIWAAGGAIAQVCGAWDNRFGTPVGLGASVLTSTLWDADGTGPDPARLVVGGSFLTAGGAPINYIARWDGAAWQSLGTATDGTVYALTTWDPDGSGPLAPDLVAGGRFTSAGGEPANFIARWDGSAWYAFGAGLGGLVSTVVYALTAWDPDGPGPMGEQVVAGGEDLFARGGTLSRVACWNGSEWETLGSGVNSSVRALTTWDADGQGPQPPRLVTGGAFNLAGGQTANRVALWDGAAWHPLGTGTNHWVHALCVCDLDGSGAQPEQLVVGGRFTTAGGVDVNHIARWDGAAWAAFGTEMNDDVYSFTMSDLDGPGPQEAQLLAGGSFTIASGVTVNRVARWDGQAWNPLGAGMTATGEVRALVAGDLDGAGPQPTQIVAGGTFAAAGGHVVNYIARWEGSEWRQFGNGFNLPVIALTTWDSGGTAPATSNLVAGGGFTISASGHASKIASWDGSTWRSLATQVDGGVYALANWHADEAGSPLEQIVAGGYITGIDGQTVNNVARWDGAAWQTLGQGVSSTVLALAAWDADGPQLLPAQLVAGGYFDTAGGATANRVAGWDGVAWSALGSGVSEELFPEVLALAKWDPDGPGPQTAQVVAGGKFTMAGGQPANFIARWDGATWYPLGSGMSFIVSALTTWDPDGDGPQPEYLIAGGGFSSAGGVSVNHIARWDGAGWQSLGSGLGGHASALATWDPDGSGPLGPQLVVGGGFTGAGNGAANRIALWDGASWHPFAIGLNAMVRALSTWDPDGDGPQPDQLVAGGDFTTAGGLPASYIALWSTQSCNACTDIDFNNDGVSPDTTDLFDYLAVFSGAPCPSDPAPGCDSLDFNNDGVYPDTTDITTYLLVFSGGLCP